VIATVAKAEASTDSKKKSF